MHDTDAQIQTLIRRLGRLKYQRSDLSLLRTRDHLLKLHSGVPTGRFWDYIHLFDDAVEQRRSDGSIQRYQTARELLVDAARALRNEGKVHETHRR